MLNKDVQNKLKTASSLEEVKDIVRDNPELDAERLWQEIEKHHSAQNEKLDLEELDAVAGGADRDWVKDGCAATCEEDSWCWSNDRCDIWDVTYERFWSTCPDGHEHVYDNGKCIRCGYHTKRPGTGPLSQ